MVRIIKIQPLTDFIKLHAQYSNCINTWIQTVKKSNWQKPQDIVDKFGTKAIDILGKHNKKVTDRVVFDVGGNNVRIIAKYVFHEKLKSARLYIKWIGTHAEYDKLKKGKQQYTIDLFK